MQTSLPPIAERFLADQFSVRSHIGEFCHLSESGVEKRFQSATESLANLANAHFDPASANQFYADEVADEYLFDLAAWHCSSKDYIADTIALIEQTARGRVMDFGGGIGTHTIAAALCDGVERVDYVDINPANRNFVQYRKDALGLDKLHIHETLNAPGEFDVVICFDVLEHLQTPAAQLQTFHTQLKDDGHLLANWYFFKGFDQEFPFHYDEPEIKQAFFEALRLNYIEDFHPYLITARRYQRLAGGWQASV